MPLDCYDGFVWKLDPISRAYEIIKCRDRAPEIRGTLVRTMRIACRENEAEILLDLANKLYPDTAPDIRKAIDSAK